MDIEVITEYNDFIALEEEWNTLLEKCPNENVFLTHDWFRCWWEAFSSEKSLFVILVKDTGKIIAIAPLMISEGKHRGLPVRKLTFMKDDNAAHADFIVPERKNESISLIIDYLQTHKKLWDIAVLENIIDEFDTYSVLQSELKEKSMSFYINKAQNSPYISISSDWDTYYADKSSKFRKTLRNMVNRVKRLGEYSIEEYTTQKNLDNILEEIYKISAKSWKGKIQSDISKSTENKNFFSKLSETAAKKGWLSIWLLKVDKKAIVMEYHLNYKKKVYALRSDFDESYNKYSPGSVINYEIIKKYFEKDITEYDMCGDAYDYKMKWGCETRKHSVLYIFNSNIYSHMIYIMEEKIIGLLRKIKAKHETHRFY